jgi:hypothetical protein
VERLADIAARNQRALRDTKIKLAWVTAIVVALIAVAVGVSMGLGKPHVAPRQPAPPAAPADHVDDVLLRRSK